MHSYTEQQFNIPDLQGLSAKQLGEHLKLYAGYVKHVNLIREKIRELEGDKEKNAYLISELRRRFSFEFNGMRMHEYYFETFEGGPTAPIESSPLEQNLVEKYGDIEKWLEHFKTVGMTRGIGWAVLYLDPKAREPHTVWVGDHELGTLAGLPILLAMDMWEHAYMVDYAPSEKKNYIEAFFKNVNWGVVEKRFQQTQA
ncbi:MAG: superoxide dismutase [Parcubacteria group bacterium]|nr:superoxide dismutase [Parcubacteria group bacterium]